MTKLLAFDLEIAKPLPDGATDWKAHRPLGISCAATLASNPNVKPLVWFGQNDDHDVAAQMSKREVTELVIYLRDVVELGYTIVSWNGLSFDFDVLAEESGQHAICRELALNHIDMMFHVFAIRGHYLGLDKAAKGLGLSGKLEGVNGAMAPDLWRAGEYQTVLDYIAQDVRTTLDVAQKAIELGRVQWMSSKGRLNQFPLKRWLTVNESLRLPLPDTSWMDAPAKREDMLAWTQL